MNKRILAIMVCIIALMALTGVASAANDSQGSQPPDLKNKAPKGGPKFYTDKSNYKFNEEIEFILRNEGARTIWVPNIFKVKWEIVNTKTHQIIYIPLGDCGYNCGPDFNKLEFGQKIVQDWDQFDNEDEHVPPGTYQASATYTFNNPQQNLFTKVFTKNFRIKKP